MRFEEENYMHHTRLAYANGISKNDPDNGVILTEISPANTESSCFVNQKGRSFSNMII